jgi:hypothetical protein
MLWVMTSTTHEADVLAPTRLRRALASPWLRSRSALVHGLAPLAALGVLVLLLDGHGVSWLAGLVAGASTGVWLVGVRAPSLALAPAAPLGVDHGDADTREQLSLLETAGWRAIHDLEASYARYRHVTIGPGGVIVLQSQRLEYPYDADDPNSQRELLAPARVGRRGQPTARDREHNRPAGLGPGRRRRVVGVPRRVPAGRALRLRPGASADRLVAPAPRSALARACRRGPRRARAAGRRRGSHRRAPGRLAGRRAPRRGAPRRPAARRARCDGGVTVFELLSARHL